MPRQLRNETIHFSVVLPVYHGDNPEHLDECLQSLHDQTHQASEIVMVKDGPLTPALDAVVQKWEAKMPALRPVALEKNMGLNHALNEGLRQAKNGWVARMDADDICRPDRFEKQVRFLDENPEIDMLGSWIEEFREDPHTEKRKLRTLPTTHEEIYRYAKWRCPFNHMTVFYRKSIVDEFGGYPNYGAVGDDYVLWVNILMHSYQCANIPEPLVLARTGKDFFHRRRRGMRYLRYELMEIRHFLKIGFISEWQYLVHFVSKCIVRLSPPWLVRFWYTLLRKS